MAQLGEIGNEMRLTGPLPRSPSWDRAPKAARVPGLVQRHGDTIVARPRPARGLPDKAEPKRRPFQPTDGGSPEIQHYRFAAGAVGCPEGEISSSK